jgi:hypothetical protein
MSSSFNVVSFLGRWVLAIVLVFGSYNPTGHSYLGWAFGEGVEFGPEQALAGVALLIGWIIFLRSTFLAMGWLGMLLGGAFCACLVWLLVDQGWVDIGEGHTLNWIVLLILSLLLAVGMSWGHIRRRLSGQVSVDDVED